MHLKNLFASLQHSCTWRNSWWTVHNISLLPFAWDIWAIAI